MRRYRERPESVSGPFGLQAASQKQFVHGLHEQEVSTQSFPQIRGKQQVKITAVVQHGHAFAHQTLIVGLVFPVSLPVVAQSVLRQKIQRSL